jgi:hypothetical protein
VIPLPPAVAPERAVGGGNVARVAEAFLAEARVRGARCASREGELRAVYAHVGQGRTIVDDTHDDDIVVVHQ